MQLVHSLCLKLQYGILFGGGDTYERNMTPHSFPYLEILNNLDIGIALFDAEGNYLFVNTELVNWRNIPMLEFLKMNVHDFLNILDVCVFDLVKKKNHRVSGCSTIKIRTMWIVKEGSGL